MDAMAPRRALPCPNRVAWLLNRSISTSRNHSNSRSCSSSSNSSNRSSSDSNSCNYSSSCSSSSNFSWAAVVPCSGCDEWHVAVSVMCLALLDLAVAMSPPPPAGDCHHTCRSQARRSNWRWCRASPMLTSIRIHGNICRYKYMECVNSVCVYSVTILYSSISTHLNISNISYSIIMVVSSTSATISSSASASWTVDRIHVLTSTCDWSDRSSSLHMSLAPHIHHRSVEVSPPQHRSEVISATCRSV